MNGIQVDIHLTPGATPKSLKYRTVPYAIQEMVEEALLRLEKEGIIEKVEYSVWATPLVWHSPALWGFQTNHQLLYGN